MEIIFDNFPLLWFLALVPLLVALHFYSLRYVRQKAMRFANFEALEKIVQGGDVLPKNYAILLMRIFTLIAFTLAAAGMNVRYEADFAPYDFVVAIDASSSMLANDLAPTRLGASTYAVSEWISTLPAASRVGIVDFSSQARAILPPSKSANDLESALLSVAPSQSGGTAICEAIKTGTNMLLPSNAPRALVLLTDGQNNAGCSLDEGMDYAKANNVTVFPIGVGSRSGGSIAGLDEVFFTLDEDSLIKLALQTGGEYKRAENATGLKNAFSQLAMTVQRQETVPLSGPMMAVAFIFVFIDWGLSVTRYRSIP